MEFKKVDGTTDVTTIKILDSDWALIGSVASYLLDTYEEQDTTMLIYIEDAPQPYIYDAIKVIYGVAEELKQRVPSRKEEWALRPPARTNIRETLNEDWPAEFIIQVVKYEENGFLEIELNAPALSCLAGCLDYTMTTDREIFSPQDRERMKGFCEQHDLFARQQRNMAKKIKH